MVQLGPGIAAILTGIVGDWSKLDNGRIVVVVRELKEGRWVVTTRHGDEPLHARAADGAMVFSRGAVVHRRVLLPICRATELQA